MSNTLYLLPLCLQTALLIQPWEVFDLAVLLTSFFVDTRPNVQVHTHIATPVSGGRGWGGVGGLRTGSGHQPGQRVLLDHVQVAFPLLAFETGGLLFAIFMQFSSTIL